MKHKDNYKYGRFYLKINGKQAESSTTKKIKSKKIKIIFKKKKNQHKKKQNKTNLKSLSLLRFGLQKFKVDFHRSKHEVCP